MFKMPKCTFCKKEIRPGTGKMYVKKEGKIIYICSAKCEKNMLKLKRKALSLKWTEKKKG